MNRLLVLVGRLLFSVQFFYAMGTLFGEKAVTGAATQGFPLPAISAKIAALMALIGASSIAFGYRTKLGAWLIIVFLIPVTFTMHAYWKIEDPVTHAAQAIAFFKNINAIGGALLLAHFGAGPFSVDAALKQSDRNT